MASSNPDSTASVLATEELTYSPLTFPRAGISVVVDSSPRRDSAANRHLDVQIGSKGHGEHGDLVIDERGAVGGRLHHAQADLLGRLVDQRAHVDVLAKLARTHNGAGDVDQLVVGMRDRHAQDLGGLPQTLEVLPRAEEVHLAVVVVPIAADALDYAGPIVERVRHDAHPGVSEIYKRALKKAFTGGS